MKLYEEIEKSFPKLKQLFSERELCEFRNIKICNLELYNFSLGLWIRNNLIYVRQSELKELFLENGIHSPDDMSTIVIKIFHYDLLCKK